ncbi:MAG TPA: type II toxin-antitoxin system VapC family toxin [Gemmatimonadota bacterium]|nr:type II toxin-antitoxin system VapC family toxin [Gemmatimonadota bacterium]
MILCDVNVLVYAFRRDMDEHEVARTWLDGTVNAPRSYGVSDLVSSAFLRIVTNPRIFQRPSTTRKALEFVSALRERSNAMSVSPGPRHWSIFADLCREREVRGDVIPDAWLAALAIESGSEWITTDRGFGRFPGLRWRHPFE